MNETNKARLALLPVLAELVPAGHIGRTALMKYMYILQTIRGLPLGYDFSMYSYGPFDSAVLADLDSAEVQNIVDVSPIEFAGGYGFRITPGARADVAKRNAVQFLSDHEKDLEWLLSVFGKFNSAELELAGTIVYVDREFAKTNYHASIGEITSRANEVKPRFTYEQVHTFVEELRRQDVLVSTERIMSKAV
jgi:uncharacterized protein